MKKLILLTVVFILHSPVFCQVGVGTGTPESSAILELDVSSENDKKGFLPPRMTAAERMNILSPAVGLVVYNTTEKCLNFFNGTGWVSACNGSIVFPPFPLNARFGGNGNDQVYYSSIKQTADGGFIIAGRSTSSSSGDVSGTTKGNGDAWILKLDITGNKVWDKLLGGTADDRAYAVQQTSDGGYIVAGYSTSSASGDVSGTNHGSNDYWVLKLDANGNIVWNKLLGGSGNDQATSVQQTSDGGYIVAGHSQSSASGDVSGTNHNGWDYWIVKLDTSGNKTWDKLLGGNSTDQAYSIRQTTDGGYIIAGDTTSSASGDVTETFLGSNDYWIVKLDASGNISWNNRLGGNSFDQPHTIQQTSDGGYIVAGSSNSSATGDVSGISHGDRDFWVVKLDAAGNKTWDKLLGGSGKDEAYSIQQTIDGGYVVAGYSLSSATGNVTDTSNGSEDYWVVKLDASGNKIWDKLLGGSGSDTAYSVWQTTDSGYVIIGESAAESAGNGDQAGVASRGQTDIWVIRLDENGDIIQ